jgi:hypothetical protein
MDRLPLAIEYRPVDELKPAPRNACTRARVQKKRL